MTNNSRKTIREHMTAGARDILVMSAVVSLLFSVAAVLSRPYWEPFSQLPVELEMLRQQVAEIQVSVNDRLKPRIIDFEGTGQIVGPKKVRPGESITIMYFMRRNASCDTDVSRVFFNVDTGVKVETDTFRATKAPVTESYILFKVNITIPMTVRPAMYAYTPALRPVDCGVYREMNVPPTEIFEVVPHT